MAKDTSSKDSPTTVSMLKGSSLTSVVQQELERSILSGEFAPGAKLVESALANKLGVSRGPVREAFRMLEEAGLVVNEKNRGVFVRDLPIDDALEIYELRAHMEQAVGRRLAVTITRDQLKEVRWMVESMERSAKLQDRSVYHLLNLQFHEHLVDMAGNRRLSALHRKLTAELALFRRINLDKGGALPLSNTEHRSIVKAIASGDADAAGKALYDHVMESRDRSIASAARRAAARATWVGPQAQPDADTTQPLSRKAATKKVAANILARARPSAESKKAAPPKTAPGPKPVKAKPAKASAKASAKPASAPAPTPAPAAASKVRKAVPAKTSKARRAAI